MESKVDFLSRSVRKRNQQKIDKKGVWFFKKQNLFLWSPTPRKLTFQIFWAGKFWWNLITVQLLSVSIHTSSYTMKIKVIPSSTVCLCWTKSLSLHTYIYLFVLSSWKPLNLCLNSHVEYIWQHATQNHLKKNIVVEMKSENSYQMKSHTLKKNPLKCWIYREIEENTQQENRKKERKTKKTKDLITSIVQKVIAGVLCRYIWPTMKIHTDIYRLNKFVEFFAFFCCCRPPF